MQDMTASSTILVNPTYVYIGAFVDELQRSGLHHVVICPGSRSTPLALTFARQQGIRYWTHLDERSAAFFALGMAKRLGQAVALLCTSGTGAANFLPAIVEARLSHVPLLVLTADRPPELRDCGAPQAIDQNRLYGTHVKWFFDLALPEATDSALRFVRSIANRAVSLAQAVASGPVHLNFPLREPLTPEALPNQTLPPIGPYDVSAWYGRSDNLPYVLVDDAPLASAPASVLEQIAQGVEKVERALIIVGPQEDPALVTPLIALAGYLGYPVLADPLSQLRCGTHDHQTLITSYDAFLRSPSVLELQPPKLIFRFGAFPTGKPLQQYLQRYGSCPQIIVDGSGGWEEPIQLASRLLNCDPAAFCRDLLALITSRSEETNPTNQSYFPWLQAWVQLDRQTQKALHAAMQEFDTPFEGRIFTELAEILPDEAVLYVGNSMPVRDLDTFFWSSYRQIHVFGNRGANGIDGVVSSALGASAASMTIGENQPTLLVIGDISFFHDLNGLLAARLHHLNLVIVLVNNDGGGIFSFLPQAAYPEHFEQLFGTPTGLEFALLAQAYGGRFLPVKKWEEFRHAVVQGFTEGGLHIIEVQTERASNVTMHRSLWQVVEHALSTREENL